MGTALDLKQAQIIWSCISGEFRGSTGKIVLARMRGVGICRGAESTRRPPLITT